MSADAFVDILFDGPPGPECGRFVEIESPPGTSIRFGEWIERRPHYWSLRISHEQMAAVIEGDDYRVLRRLRPRAMCERLAIAAAGEELKRGIVLDTETTGLEPVDEIIELAMVPFSYTPDGRIYEIGMPFHALRQPAKPITTEITRITGIDAAMVEGKAINAAAVEAFIADAQIIIAHHAAFDRPFAERLNPAFAKKCWACSMSEIDWKGLGAESQSLRQLLADRGLFYDRHRATSDCLAVIELLISPLPQTGVLGLAQLLDTARRETRRLWADGSPFEMKDVLKARGYRWSDGKNGVPKSWYIDVTLEQLDSEIEFLRAAIFRRTDIEFLADRLTAFTRFR